MKISFAKNGIQLRESFSSERPPFSPDRFLSTVGEVAQQHFPGRNIYPILQKTLMRIYAAVYVLIDVEWRANHISPYDKHSIHFESNRRFSREHPPRESSFPEGNKVSS